MMCTLQCVFANPYAEPRIRNGMALFDFQLMRVLRSIGEALALLPADKTGTKTAGPSFSMSRHVQLLVQPIVALTVANDRMQDLVARARDLANDKRKPTKMVKEALAALENPSKRLNMLLTQG